MIDMRDWKIIGVAFGLVAVFAFGRYSVKPQDVKTKENTEITKEVKKRIEIVKVKKPDGTETTNTVITEDTNTDIKKVVESEVSTKPSKKINISLMAESRLNELRLDYGVSVSKEILGPITAGLYAKTSGIVGITLGINF